MRTAYLSILAPVLVATLLLAACDEAEEALSGATPPATTGLDYEAILNDVEEVRSMLNAAASQYSPEVIEDVDYSGDTLTLTAGPDATGVQDAEALCEDVADAIALGTLSIRVVDPTGSELATCQFEGGTGAS